MNAIVRLLLVEDSDDDALLLIHTLKKSGMNLFFKRVETAEDFLSNLNSAQWDIIISDYALPHFSGSEALKLTRSILLDIPFIIVSGTIGEDVAVAMMRAGANDYIMKGNLVRLVTAIERELKEAEIHKQHRKAKEERDSIFNLSLDLICIADFDGFFKQLNPAWIKVLGFTTDELKSKPFFEFVHPDDRDETINAFKKLSTGTNNFSFGNRYQCKNGDYKWFMWNGTTSPEQKLFYAIARDMTDYKKAQEALNESEKKYRFLADNTLDIMWQMNLNLVSTYVNPAIHSMLGYEPSEFISTSLDKYCTNREMERIRAVLEHSLADTNISRGIILETELLHKNGKAIPVEVHATMLNDENGKPIGIQGTTRNITERKKSQEELIKSKESAEEANRLKSGFLAAMSHEIRTPLNAILGFNYVLKEIFFDSSVPNVKKYFSYIEEAGKRLLNTISAILDISRIEANEFSINLTKISLNKAVVDTYNICKILSDDKGLKINLDLPSDDLFVLGDEYCLNGILTNVINNSIKYSDKGTINISIQRNGHNAECYITDEGIGISEEYQKHLFETFSQEKVGWNRKYEGSGLGLALTKRYITLMDGQITIESKKNIGTKVTFKIPLYTK